MDAMDSSRDRGGSRNSVCLSLYSTGKLEVPSRGRIAQGFAPGVSTPFDDRSRGIRDTVTSGLPVDDNSSFSKNVIHC